MFDILVTWLIVGGLAAFAISGVIVTCEKNEKEDLYVDEDPRFQECGVCGYYSLIPELRDSENCPYCDRD